MTANHRPRYVLWIAGQPTATCQCHYGQPVRLDRQMGAKK
jgi:hypothetical protein